MKNKYTVVETNRLMMEDVNSIIDGEARAKADIENGRLLVRGTDGDFEYAKDGSAEELWLSTTPEKMYDGAGLDEFINEKGRLLRAVKIMVEDEYSTTAFEGDFKVGDKVCAGAKGMLVEDTDGVIKFEVIGKRLLSKEIGITVRRIA